MEALEERAYLSFDVEPNDNLAQAFVLSPGTAEGFIGNGSAGAADEDFYQFTLNGSDLANFSGYGYGGYNYGNGTSLHLYDSGGTDISNRLSYWGTFFSDVGGTFYAKVTGPVGPYTLNYAVQNLGAFDVTESNDSIATAQPIDVATGSSLTVNGFLGETTGQGDSEYFAVYLPGNTVLDVSVSGYSGLPFSGGGSIQAFDGTGTLLASNLAYYQPLHYYSFAEQTVYVRYSERADLMQAYHLTFQVSALDPNLLDPEPNGTLGTALAITAGVPRNGFIGNGSAGASDEDFFQFTLNGNDLASFSGYGYGGYNYGNGTSLRLYDSSGADLSDRLSYWGTFFTGQSGTFYAKVTGPVGPYTLNYAVQNLGAFEEMESNDSIATAQPISVATGSSLTVNGFLGETTGQGDPEYFAVYLPANTVLDVSVSGYSGLPFSGGGSIQAFDGTGALLASNLAYYQPLHYYSFAEQTVYVRYSERADLMQAYHLTFQVSALDASLLDPEPNDTLGTSLSVTPGVPRNGFIGNGSAGASDEDFFQFTLNENDLASFSGYGYGGYNYGNGTSLHLYDSSGTDISDRLSYWGTFFTGQGGTFYAKVTGPVGPYRLSYVVQNLGAFEEMESNDSIATAQPISVAMGSSLTLNGFLGETTGQGDPEYFAVYLPGNTVLDVSVRGYSGLPFSGGGSIQAFDGTGALLASNLAYYQPLHYYSFVGQTVYVRYSERADLMQAYQITFSAADSGLNLTLPSISRLNDTSVREDQSTPAISFTIGDPQDPAENLTVTASSADPSLANVVLDGSGAERSITVLPTGRGVGPVQVSVTVTDTDGNATTNVFVVQITDAPLTATGMSLSATAGVLFAGAVAAFEDANQNSLPEDFRALIEWGDYATSLGTIVGADGAFVVSDVHTYAAAGDYPITVSIADIRGTTVTTVSRIHVAPANRPPEAEDDFYTIDEDRILEVLQPGVLGNDRDPDGDRLVVTGYEDASHGTVVLNSDGTMTFTPDANFHGTAGFDYSVCDGSLCDTGHVSITVNPVNDAPIGQDDSYTIDEGRVLSVSAPGVLTNDEDVDGDPLTVVAHTNPANGTLVLNADGSFTYTPDTTFVGVESFSYRINDGNGATSTATVTINVTAAAPGSMLLVKDTCLGGTALLITGTSGNDIIVVEPGATGATLKVTFNGVVTTQPRPTSRIIVTGGNGDDNIQIAGAITNPVWLYGDAGNDRLNAGNGGSLLTGGDGNDQLLGGSGRDILIGGEGADNLVGNSNDDILVAGYTTKDTRASVQHEDFWCEVMNEWNSNRSFAERIGRLRPSLLPQVIDDVLANSIDFLNGSAGDDWLIFAAGEDKVTGKAEQSN